MRARFLLTLTLNSIVIACILLPLTLGGAVRTWTGGVSANWSDGGNWFEGVAPTTDDTVIISTGVWVTAGYAPEHLDIASLKLDRLVFSNDIASFTLDGYPFTVNMINGLNDKGSRITNTIMQNVAMSNNVAWTVNIQHMLILRGVISEAIPNWVFAAYGNGRILFANKNTFSGGCRNDQTMLIVYHDQGFGVAPATPNTNYFRTSNGSWQIMTTTRMARVVVDKNRGMQSTGTAVIFPGANTKVTYNGVIEDGGAIKNASFVGGGVAAGGDTAQGIITLGASNTFSGNCAVGGGNAMVIMDSDSALGLHSVGKVVLLYSTVDLNGHDLLRDLSSNNGQGYRSIGMLRNRNTQVAARVTGNWKIGSTSGILFGGPGDIIYTGALSGNNPVAKGGSGVLTFTGTNSFIGNITIRGGGFVLDYREHNYSKVSTTNRTLYLANAALTCFGNNAAPFTETILDLDASTEANRSAGANGVRIVSGTNQNFCLAARTVRVGRSDEMDIELVHQGSGEAILSNSSPVAVIPATGVMQGNVTFGKKTWAVTAGGIVVGLADNAYETDFSTSTTNSNMDITGDTAISANSTALTLRFNTGTPTTVTIDAGRTLSLSGMNGGNIPGILIPPHAGAVGIHGGNINQGLNNTLHIHHYGANPLVIGARFSVGSGSAVAKCGGGELILTNDLNQFAGLHLYQGTVTCDALTNGGVASQLGTSSSITLGDGTLRYVGTGHTSNKRIILRGAGTLDASGSGPLEFNQETNYVFMTQASNGGNDYQVTLTGSGTGIINGGLNLVLGGVTKEGPGLWVLNGSNAFEGNTYVRQGTLAINGMMYGNIILAGGTLTGTGDFEAASILVDNGGTLTPGGSVGTLVACDITMKPGSVYAWEVDAGNGTADLARATSVLQLPEDAPNSVTVKVVQVGGSSAISMPIFAFDTLIGDTNALVVDTSGTGYGQPSITASDTSISVGMIPEPAAAGAVLLAILLRRRRA